MSYDNDMEIILSKVVSDKPNAPAWRVTFEMDGQKYKAGLWVWDRKDGTFVTDQDGNKKYKGKIEIDDYTPPASQPEPAKDFDDDDIPF